MPNQRRDGELKSVTGENDIEMTQPSGVRTRAMVQAQPRVAGSKNDRGREQTGIGGGGRRGRRGTGNRNPDPQSVVPAPNLAEEITRALGDTLPDILRGFDAMRRREDEERRNKENEELRICLEEEEMIITEKEEAIHKMQQELASLKAGGSGSGITPGSNGCTYKEFVSSKPREFRGTYDDHLMKMVIQMYKNTRITT